MTSSPNPNRKPFPRRNFLGAILNAGFVERLHPLQRSNLEAQFRALDPKSWPHSLGAADAILDNLGLLMGEQFANDAEQREYFGVMRDLLQLYSIATSLVTPYAPWTGNYVLGKARRANAGEPSPV